jgi:hypothetical protein
MIEDVIGWIGAIVILVAYFLVAGKRLPATSAIFHTANLLGGAAVALSSLAREAWPAAALNTTWALIGLYGLTRIWRARTVPERVPDG